MRSQALRLTLGTVSWIAMGACAVFLFYSEERVAERRAAFRAFDVRGRETVAALSELRMAQQAYVAAGQSVISWATKVDSASAAARESLATLREKAASGASKLALEDAMAMVADFLAIDKRIRGYLLSDAQLMASDVIFTEGGETAANAARQVERARLEERDLVQASEETSRKQEATAVGAAAALAFLVMGVLIRGPARKAAGSKPPIPEARQEDWAPARDDLVLRQGPAEISPPPTVRQPVDTPVARTATALKNAAQVCT